MVVMVVLTSVAIVVMVVVVVVVVAAFEWVVCSLPASRSHPQKTHTL